MGMAENGFRQLTNSVRPVHSVEDMKNLKLRVAGSNLLMKCYELWGADATNMNWSETYTALQQGTVDGQENPLANIWEVKMFEVQKYCSLTGHIYDPMPLVANLNWFNKLPRDYQAIVLKGAEMAQNYSRFVNQAREDAIIDKLRVKGMKVNDVTPANKEKLRLKSQGIVVAKIKASTDKAFVDQWLGAIKAVNKDVNAGF